MSTDHVDERPQLRRLHGPLTLLTAAALAASCATQPLGSEQGKPIFASFNQCMIANGAGAVLVGLLAKELTGKNAAGVAATAATLFVAWKVCGQTHQRVAVSDERAREVVLRDPSYRAAARGVLAIDDLEVTAPKAGEDITTRYRFTYTSADAAKKDIAAKEKFVFLAGFVNDRGAQEFKDIEFNRDFVIQQGQRRHEHAVPSDSSFGQFKPWKLRYTLEVDGRCMQTEATFAVGSTAPGRAGPATPCSTTVADATRAQEGGSKAAAPETRATAPAVVVPAPTSVGAAPVAEGALVRALRLQAQPNGAATGKTLALGTVVQMLETRQLGTAARPVPWVRVRAASGETGWTLGSNLKR